MSVWGVSVKGSVCKGECQYGGVTVRGVTVMGSDCKGSVCKGECQ